MKTYYELLAVDPAAAPDEIKRAFRREIARYHPDKVQHLGPEFQEIASTRAAELTEAYRVLMDEGSRQRYDEGLKDGAGRERTPPPPPPPQPSAEPRPPAEPSTHAEPSEAHRGRERDRQDRTTINEFVRRAILARLRDAVEMVAGNAASMTASGFEVAYSIKPKGGLFKKADPAVRVLVRVVPQADASAVEEAWRLALKTAAKDVACVLLLGASGMAPSKELSAAVAEQRRKSRGASVVIVPVDVRDWEALFPPEAPAVVRTLIQWLRAGKT